MREGIREREWKKMQPAQATIDHLSPMVILLTLFLLIRNKKKVESKKKREKNLLQVERKHRGRGLEVRECAW